MIAYQQFAQIYDRLMQDIPYDAYVEWVEQSVGDLKQLKVLDLGCGTGTLSHAMAERGAIVSGVDLSPQMIEVAKERYPSIQFSEGA
ncbi:MAG TPA: methyltransferase domain-containing protein, partial [Savagea sp.]